MNDRWGSTHTDDLSVLLKLFTERMDVLVLRLCGCYNTDWIGLTSSGACAPGGNRELLERPPRLLPPDDDPDPLLLFPPLPLPVVPLPALMSGRRLYVLYQLLWLLMCDDLLLWLLLLW
uniref:Uncharacterized protein n=1 Tax=Anopheles culicifacies TaxID=139723 RepID=A0A182LUG1_9DIPT